jgi:hypothetical protein
MISLRLVLTVIYNFKVMNCHPDAAVLFLENLYSLLTNRKYVMYSRRSSEHTHSLTVYLETSKGLSMWVRQNKTRSHISPFKQLRILSDVPEHRLHRPRLLSRSTKRSCEDKGPWSSRKSFVYKLTAVYLVLLLGIILS